MRYTRLHKLQNYVLKKDFVSWDELCKVFGKSKNTLRRDVMELVQDGVMEKVYGGVRVSRQPAILHNFAERTIKSPDQKGVIGALAARLVQDHDVIYIDSGTTTLNILPHLVDRVGVTMLSNNLHAINYCIDLPGLDVIALGGQLNRETRSFDSNHCSIERLDKLNINKAFMAATGVSIEKGVTNTMGELAIKQKVVERSDKCYLLADSSKFDRSALLTYAELISFDCVITDQPPPARYRAFFDEKGIELISGSA